MLNMPKPTTTNTIKINLMPEKSSLKSKKKPKPPRTGKEIDMLKFKKKIADEMANAIASKIEVDPQSQYSARYREYISEDFTSTCIVFINRLISDSKTLSSDLKNENNIHKHLLRIIKELMMDEYEITVLSLYLDEYGWTTDQFSIEDHLLYVALLVKKSMKSSDLFMKYYEQIDKGIIDSFNKWTSLNNEPKTYCHNEIDLRFRKLKKPFNTYCKTNYIDYNSVVDKILRMSLPYNETNKPPKEENLDHTIDDSIPNTSHMNIIENIKEKKPVVNQNNTNNEYSYKPTDLLLNSLRYNTDYNSNGNNHQTSMNNNNNNSSNNLSNRGIQALQRSNPKIFTPKQVIKQDQNLRENLKATTTNSNPYLQGLNIYNTSMKFDDTIINTENNNPLSYYWNPQNLLDSNNPLKQASNPHLDPISNRNDNESLHNLLNKSNNNFFRSAFSTKEFFNPDLDPFHGSSLMSKNFEQLVNDRLKGPEARSNTNLSQIRFDDNSSKVFPMNYMQGGNYYCDNYTNKKDNNYNQIRGLDNAGIINSLFNNQNMNQMNSHQSHPSGMSSSNDSNAIMSDKNNRLAMFNTLKNTQTRDR